MVKKRELAGVILCAAAAYLCEDASSEKSLSRAMMCAVAGACMGPIVANYVDKSVKAGAPVVRDIVEKVRNNIKS